MVPANSDDSRIDDVRIASIRDIAVPAQVMAEVPVSSRASGVVRSARNSIHEILNGRDDRLITIVGPCSIHDSTAAMEYANRLRNSMLKLSDDLLIVMRVYFEKPRTTIGWKGLINDPDLDGTFDINKGLRLARTLLLELNNIGVPAGVEFLDIVTPQYIADLVSWGAIGARTTESQVHRQLVSGLSCPVGMKNGTDGNLQIAVDGAHAASRSHRFLSLRKDGRTAIFETSGNEDCHIILRGGKVPNYKAEDVNSACELLVKRGLAENIMIDFSHANSSKQFFRQMDTGRDVGAQIAAGDARIKGVMIESHLVEGRQDNVPGQELVYGQSITDACIGWDDTEVLLNELAQAVRQRRNTTETFASVEAAAS
ncbi:MAG: 3-deoxy-7-phosphoheptulonate synthase [Acidiferrobacterales bacterium]|nr:3-deoxy-7-phosphoheptulonate synthase [Acidiferrobacterales bacterium]